MKHGSIIGIMIISWFLFLAPANQIDVHDFMNQVGIQFPENTQIGVNQAVTAKIVEPEKLKKLGINFPVKKDDSVKVTFKSDKMAEIIFPSRKKKAYIGNMNGKWELQAILGVN